MKRVSRNLSDDQKRLEAVDLSFYALRKDGEYAGASLWDKRSASAAGGAQFAVCGADGQSHRENSVYLYQRK